MTNLDDPEGQTRAIGVDFLRTELTIGQTLAESALAAGADADQRARNRADAHTAYETVIKHMEQVALTSGEVRELSERLAKLRGMIDATPPPTPPDAA